jgi:hypothetical protein
MFTRLLVVITHVPIGRVPCGERIVLGQARGESYSERDARLLWGAVVRPRRLTEAYKIPLPSYRQDRGRTTRRLLFCQ